tara:strand:- start:238 stop:2268 length:2031 start_codon:yes stop_codon:yes gene_type:complete
MTFGIKTEGANKAVSDIDKVSSATKNAEASQDELNSSIETGSSALDGMTGGAIGAFKGVVSGVKKAVLGMRTLKGAIISTGIGALVPIVASIVLYLTRTKRGAEQLEKASAVLGATMDVLAEALIPVGELLVTMFTDPQKAIASLETVLGPVGAFLNTLFTDPMQGIQDFGVMIKDYVLGAFAKILEGSNLLTGSLFKLFSGDFQGAWEDASAGALVYADGLTDLMPLTAQMKMSYNLLNLAVDTYGDVIMTAAEKTIALTEGSQRLADAQRALSVEFAQTRAKMTELKLISEDTTLSLEKRIAATEEAGALEQALADKSLALAEIALSIQRQKNSMTENTADDLQAVADLEIALSNAQIESAGKYTEILMKVNSLKAEDKALTEAANLLEAERLTALISMQSAIDDIKDAGMERELQKIEDHWAEQIRLATEAKGELEGVEKAKELQLKAVREKFQAKADSDAESNRQKIKDGIITTAKAVLSGLEALNKAFTELSGAELDANAARELAISEETDEARKKQLIKNNNAILAEQEKQQKKGFENSKKLQIAQALIQTYTSATAAFQSLAGIPLVGPILGGVAAAAAVAGGLAQVAMIKKTTFQGGGAGQQEYQAPPTTAEGVGGGGAATAAADTSPQIDLGFLGAGSGGSIQAYVISENVTNQQQADQIVTDQTTL